MMTRILLTVFNPTKTQHLPYLTQMSPYTKLQTYGYDTVITQVHRPFNTHAFDEKANFTLCSLLFFSDLTTSQVLNQTFTTRWNKSTSLIQMPLGFRIKQSITTISSNPNQYDHHICGKC